MLKKNKISVAIDALKKGYIVVYPTDTLYAFGADVFNKSAVKKVFTIKKRPLYNPLPIAVSNFADIEEISFVNENARKLAKQFLPGSLTIILDKKDIIPDIVTGGLNKIAIRIPKNPIALELLSKFGPLTVTSANIHEMNTLGNIKDINMQFKDYDITVYLNGGFLHNKPSTIVDVTSDELRIIREGTIKKHDLMAVI